MINENANINYKCPICKNLLAKEQCKNAKGDFDETRYMSKELVDRGIHMIPPGIFFRTQRYLCVNPQCKAYYKNSKRKFKIGLTGNVVNASFLDGPRHGK